MCNLQMHELCQMAAGDYLQHLGFFIEALEKETTGRKIFLQEEQELYQFSDCRFWLLKWDIFLGSDLKNITEMAAVYVTNLYENAR